MYRERFFAYRSFQPELATVLSMSEAGVDTICLTVSNTLNSLGTPYCLYPPTWIGPDIYDFSSLDRQFSDALNLNPDFRIICNIDFNAPDWWRRRFCTMNASRPDSYNELGRVCCDSFWRQDTANYLQATLRHIRDTYGGRVIRYGLLCGHTTEWYDNSMQQESPSRLEAYRVWCLEQGYSEPADIPPSSVRAESAHGLLRNPRDEAEAIRYVKFCNWQIADTIQYFARAAREIVGDEAGIGVFYGYTMIPSIRKCILQGHIGLDRVLRDGAIDFVMAPGNYGPERKAGGAGGFLFPVDSLCTHGVEYVHESDHRTATYNPCLSGHIRFSDNNSWPDEASTIAGMKREFCISLLRDASIWWFDMWGHFYDGYKVKQLISQMRDIWEEYHSHRAGSVSEVAMLIDEESWLYCNPYAEELIDHSHRIMEALGHIGSPVEFYSFADLADLDTDRLKLAILPNLFVYDDEKLSVLREKLMRDGKTLLWSDQAGKIYNDRYADENASLLTGIEPSGETKERETDGWRSVSAPAASLDRKVLRNIAEAADVSFYVEGEEPVWANDSMLAIHSAEGGEKCIHLPRIAREVKHLFRNEIVAENTVEFSDRFESPDTALYAIEWA